MLLAHVPPLLLLNIVLDRLDAASLARVAHTMRHPRLRRKVEEVIRRRAELRGRVYSESTDCPICLETIEDNDDSIVTDCCFQQLHTLCFSRSLETNSTCPCCRNLFMGTRRPDGLPRGWSSWAAFIVWNEWRTTRHRDDSRMPVAAANCITPSGSIVSESMLVTHDGSVLQRSHDQGGTQSCLHRNRDIISVHRGGDFYASLSTTGQVYTWGENKNGQTGHSERVKCEKPKQVNALKERRIISITTGATHCVAVTDRGEAFFWGSIGVFIRRVSPIMVKGLEGVRVRGVSSGHAHILIVTEDGALFSYGSNKHGQLGHGHECTEHVTVPTIVHALRNLRIAFSAAGSHHSLVLTQGGSVLTWGGYTYRTTPIFVDGKLESTKVRYISAGETASCAISVSDELFFWSHMQDDSLVNIHGSPKHVNAFTGDDSVQKVSIGSRETLAVTSSGRVYSWGTDTLFDHTTRYTVPPHILTNIRCSLAETPTTQSPQTDQLSHTRAAQWERISMLLDKTPASDGIVRLVALLRAGTGSHDVFSELATTALMEITRTSQNHNAVIQAGGIAPLVTLLNAEWSVRVRWAAAAALKHLAYNSNANQVAIMAAGAIQPLVAMLSSRPSDEEYHRVNQEAAGALKNLAFNNACARVQIAQAGAISALVTLLRADATDGVNTAAALALLNLTHDNHANTLNIVDSGAIRHLVLILNGDGIVLVKAAVTAVLCNLAHTENNKTTITAWGAIPNLVDLLRGAGGYGVYRNAARLLLSLASTVGRKEAIVRAGAIGPLVDLLREEDDSIKEAAMWMLNSLASHNDATSKAIASEEVIPFLSFLLNGHHQEHTRGVQSAAIWLLRTLSFNVNNRLDIQEAGAVRSLVRMLTLHWPNGGVKQASILVLHHVALSHALTLDHIAQENGIPALVSQINLDRAGSVAAQAVRLLRMMASYKREYKHIIESFGLHI